jgi:RNA polymerase sigma-70 factor (ECF subfamily)
MERSSSGGEGHGPVDRALAVGRRVWPALALDGETLADYLGERLSAGHAQVGDDRLADLYLACACGVRTPGAIETFVRVHLASVRVLTRSYDRSPAFADEVAQRVQARLFLGDEEGGPKIGQYRGDGPLAAWVKVAVIRVAQRLAADRHRSDREIDDVLANAITWSNNGEILMIRIELREAFKRAFAEAVQALPAKLRMALKLYAVKGVSMTAIAKMNNVDQSTISRWILESRQQLAAATRRALATSLRVTARELESLMTAMDSHMDLHLSQLLETSVASIDGGVP